MPRKPNGNGKTVTKTVTKPWQFQKGHDPRRGGGKPGRSGRRPSELGALCRDLVDKHALLERLAVIAASDHRDALGATKLLLSYGYGQPRQTIEHAQEGGGPVKFTLKLGDHAGDD